MSLADKVYAQVAQIPQGKVTTYVAVAKMIGTSPRVVGNILHRNPHSTTIPCHRVVTSRGLLAQNFAFGGIDGQKNKLLAEGITFEQDHMRVNSLHLTS